MNTKPFYKTLSVLSIVFGALLLINTQTQIAGAVISNSTLTSNSSILWGAFFIIIGIALFYVQMKNNS